MAYRSRLSWGSPTVTGAQCPDAQHFTAQHAGSCIPQAPCLTYEVTTMKTKIEDVLEQQNRACLEDIQRRNAEHESHEKAREEEAKKSADRYRQTMAGGHPQTARG